MPEAKLAREAEISYATVAMVTDFDCWHPDHDAVTVQDIIKVLTEGRREGQTSGRAPGARFSAPARAVPDRLGSRARHRDHHRAEVRDPKLLKKLERWRGAMLEAVKTTHHPASILHVLPERPETFSTWSVPCSIPARPTDCDRNSRPDLRLPFSRRRSRAASRWRGCHALHEPGGWLWLHLSPSPAPAISSPTSPFPNGPRDPAVRRRPSAARAGRRRGRRRVRGFPARDRAREAKLDGYASC